MRLLLRYSLSCLLLSTTLCSWVEAQITYHLLDQFTDTHAVTGTITTNGQLGSISADALVSVDLVVSSGAGEVFPLDVAPPAFDTVRATPRTLEWMGFGFDTVHFSDDVGGASQNRWLLLNETVPERILIVDGELERVPIPRTPHVFARAVPEPAGAMMSALWVVMLTTALRRARN